MYPPTACISIMRHHGHPQSWSPFRKLAKTNEQSINKLTSTKKSFG